jgi:hypothetical protein
MFCSKCGENINEGVQFCAKCGKAVGNESVVSQQKVIEEPTVKAKGRVLLLVAGILAIIAGALALIGILGVIAVGSFPVLFVLFGVLFGIESLLGGILGIVNSNKTAKKAMQFVSIIAFGAIISMVIWSIVTIAEFGETNFVADITMAIPCILLQVGTVLNNKKAI